MHTAQRGVVNGVADIVCGEIHIRPALRQLRVRGEVVSVGARAFDLLLALARQRGRVVPAQRLLEQVWPGRVVVENNLHVQIKALRRVLGHDAIVNVAGGGYLLVAAGDEAAADDTSDAASPPHNLLPALTRFIGRTGELADLADLLRRTRLVTLTGAGGCGKSRIALEVARRNLRDFSDGAWLVELAALTGRTQIAPAACDALGLALRTEQSPLQMLCSHFATRRALLLLDNAEHLREPCAELVQALLAAAPGLVVLVTSRQALGLAGEQVLRVPSLGLPPGDPALAADAPFDADAAAACDAVRLFVDRAAQQRPGFALTPANARDVAAICIRLDGIPLALELAAARLRALTPAELAPRLDARFALLTAGSPTALPRHQTLRALIDWSHELLAPAEQALLAGLAVFAGGCTVQAAEEVFGEAPGGATGGTADLLERLMSLVDKSLLAPLERDGGTRLRMLETVWHFARERLAASGDEARWRDAHARWCAALAAAARSELGGPGQQAYLRRIDAELDNLRGALAWCVAAPERRATGLGVAVPLLRWWVMRGRAREGLDWIVQLLGPPEAEGGGESERAESRVQSEHAESGRAQDAAEADSTHGGEAGADPGRARAHFAAGWLSFHLGEYDAAVRLQRQALALHERLGDDRGRADSLNALGSVALVRGQHAEAESALAQALAIRRACGDTRGLTQILNGLAGVAAARGDYARACAIYAEAVTGMRAAGDERGLAAMLLNHGTAMRRLPADDGADRTPAVVAIFEEVLQVSRRVGDSECTAAALYNLGRLALDRGDAPAAAAVLGESLAILRRTNDRYWLALLLVDLARLRHEAGELIAAVALYSAAERMSQEIGAPMTQDEVAERDAGLAALRAAVGDAAAFEAAWQQARSLPLDDMLASAGLAAD